METNNNQPQPGPKVDKAAIEKAIKDKEKSLKEGKMIKK